MEKGKGKDELPLTEHDDCTHWVGRMKRYEDVSNTKDTRDTKGRDTNQHVHKKSATRRRRFRVGW